MTYTYSTNFNLTHSVNDFRSAYRYLAEDDMTKYLKDDDRCTCPDAVIEICWNLCDMDSGNILLLTARELTRKELDSISEWVRGQNSDGLGEGFEQQDFATGIDDDLCVDECDENGYYMASFDWESNDYRFEKGVSIK